MEMADEMTSDSASRVTRNSRDLRRLLLAAVVCAAGMTVLRAQDVPPAAPPTPAQPAPAAEGGAGDAGNESTDDGEKVDFPDAPTADFPDAPDPGAAASKPAANAPPAAPQAKAPDAGEEEEGPPPDAAPRTPGVVGSTPGHFEPTEKVRADFDVSFPVDI